LSEIIKLAALGVGRADEIDLLFQRLSPSFADNRIRIVSKSGTRPSRTVR
jgi:hypothetical protein